GRIGVGPGAWLIRAADLNRDGKIDLIVGDFKPSNTHGALAVLLGKGDGTFRAPHYYPSGGVVVYGLGVGRMNADERPDVGTASASDTACVLLTRADGRLKPRKCTQTTPG